jgi:prophage tail gpP-like protein
MTTSVPDTRFEMVLQDGRTYKTGDGGNVTGWWIDSDYLTSTDGWTCSFQSKNKADRDLLGCAPVELKVDGRTQLIGRIDGYNKGKEGNLVPVRGRDYLGDAVECGVDPRVHIKAGDKLDQAILQAFRPIGVMGFEDPEVKMERRTGAKPKKLPKIVQADMQLTKPDCGDSIFQFGNKIAVRHGYTIQCATTRDKICLETPNYIQAAIGTIIRREDGSGGNVVDAEADCDWSSVPTFATMYGASGKATEKLGRTKFDWDLWNMIDATGAEVGREFNRWTVATRRGPTADPLIAGQLYRFLYFKDKDAKTAAQIIESVWRAACEQLKKTLVYTATLRGTCDPKTGFTYNTNTILNVDDDRADVHEPLWVQSRGFGIQKGAGVVTKLKMIRPWTFQVGKGGHGSG